MKNLKPFAISLVLVFTTSYLCRGQDLVGPSLQVRHLIDPINLSLDNHYVFSDKAQPISKLLQSQAKKKAYASVSTDPYKLGKQIQADIYKIHRDPPMLVDYNPGFAARSQDNAKPRDEEMLHSGTVII
jgi:hypothetical protein